MPHSRFSTPGLNCSSCFWSCSGAMRCWCSPMLLLLLWLAGSRGLQGNSGCVYQRHGWLKMLKEYRNGGEGLCEWREPEEAVCDRQRLKFAEKWVNIVLIFIVMSSSCSVWLNTCFASCFLFSFLCVNCIIRWEMWLWINEWTGKKNEKAMRRN